MGGPLAPGRAALPRLQGLMLKGKVVLVTGAGGGIGRDFALAMAAAGAKVLVNDLGTSVKGEGTNTGPAERVVEEIRATGGTAAANSDSVADWTSANRIVQAALDNFGRIDAVVNNAGILPDRFFFNMSGEECRACARTGFSCSPRPGSCAGCTAMAGGPRRRSQRTPCGRCARTSIRSSARRTCLAGTRSN